MVIAPTGYLISVAAKSSFVQQFCNHAAGNASSNIQSAAPQPTPDQKPKSNSLTLRRRQSFNSGDNRAGPLVPSEAGWAPSGRPPGAPTTQHDLPSTGPAPAAKAAPEQTQHRTGGGPPLHRAAPKLPQPAGEFDLRGPSAVQKKIGTGLAGGSSKSSAKAQTTAPAKSSGTPSLQRTAGSGEPAQAIKPSGAQSLQRAAIAKESGQAKRQGSSPAQLVDKYKRDAAARKQRQGEVTLERITSLAAGLQHAASGSSSATDARAASSANKPRMHDLAVVTSSSSRRSPVKGKAAVASRHPNATPMQVEHPQADTNKVVQDTAKAKLRVTKGGTTPPSVVRRDMQSSSSSGNA